MRQQPVQFLAVYADALSSVYEICMVSTGYYFPPIMQINVYKIFGNIFACFNFFSKFGLKG